MEQGGGTEQVMDRLLARKRAADRRRWLEEEGDRAEAAQELKAGVTT